MRFAKYVLLILIVFRASSSYAQSDKRWALLPGGYAKVPVVDLRYAAAYRLVSDQQRREYAWEAVQRAKQVSILKEALEAKSKEAEAISKERDAFREQSVVFRDELMECAKKRERLKTWANIGKVGVITLGAATAFLIYTQVQ